MGRYELAPNAILTVTREGAQLSVQFTEQVSAVVLHQNGQELRGPKLP